MNTDQFLTLLCLKGAGNLLENDYPSWLMSQDGRWILFGNEAASRFWGYENTSDIHGLAISEKIGLHKSITKLFKTLTQDGSSQIELLSFSFEDGKKTYPARLRRFPLDDNREVIHITLMLFIENAQNDKLSYISEFTNLLEGALIISDYDGKIIRVAGKDIKNYKECIETPLSSVFHDQETFTLILSKLNYLEPVNYEDTKLLKISLSGQDYFLCTTSQEKLSTVYLNKLKDPESIDTEQQFVSEGREIDTEQVENDIIDNSEEVEELDGVKEDAEQSEVDLPNDSSDVAIDGETKRLTDNDSENNRQDNENSSTEQNSSLSTETVQEEIESDDEQITKISSTIDRQKTYQDSEDQKPSGLKKIVDDIGAYMKLNGSKFSDQNLTTHSEIENTSPSNSEVEILTTDQSDLMPHKEDESNQIEIDDEENVSQYHSNEFGNLDEQNTETASLHKELGAYYPELNWQDKAFHSTKISDESQSVESEISENIEPDEIHGRQDVLESGQITPEGDGTNHVSEETEPSEIHHQNSIDEDFSGQGQDEELESFPSSQAGSEYVDQSQDEMTESQEANKDKTDYDEEGHCDQGISADIPHSQQDRETDLSNKIDEVSEIEKDTNNEITTIGNPSLQEEGNEKNSHIKSDEPKSETSTEQSRIKNKENVVPLRKVRDEHALRLISNVRGKDDSAFQKLAETLGAKISDDHSKLPQISNADDLKENYTVTSWADQNNFLQFDAVMEALDEGVLIFQDRKLHYSNKEFLRLIGYESLEEFANTGGFEAIFSPMTDLNSAVKTEEAISAYCGDGIERKLSLGLKRIITHQGMLSMLQLMEVGIGANRRVMSEIAERRAERAERRLVELRQLVDFSCSGTLTLDNEGHILTVSSAATQLLTRPGESPIGEEFSNFVGLESQALFFRAFKDVITTKQQKRKGVRLHLKLRTPNKKGQAESVIKIAMVGTEVEKDQSRVYCILEDISDWVISKQKLESKRVQAETASYNKTDLVRKVAHEVRNPLNIISTFSELLKQDDIVKLSPEKRDEYLNDISNSANYALALLEDILDYSKMEAGTASYKVEKTSPQEIIEDVVHTLREMAKQHKVMIRHQHDKLGLYINVDRISLKQIIWNLLSNAIKYTPEGGQVIISTLKEGNNIKISIRDSGIGMSADTLEQALIPFGSTHQQDFYEKDKRKNGLGLSIVKMMTEANQGIFNIKSKEQEGTLVEIIFPAT